MSKLENIGIFISYRRSDTKWFASLLSNRISQVLPSTSVFLDVASIELGFDFAEVLNRTLDQCAVQFVLIGDGWLTAQDGAGRRRLDSKGDWVRMEIERAFQRKLRIIPVLVDGTPMPKAEHLSPSISALSRRQSVNVTFQEQETSIMKILDLLSDICGEPLNLLPDEATHNSPFVAPTAQVVMGFFEPETNDNKTLSVLAEHQLECGRFGLAKELFSLVMFREYQEGGPENLAALRARYQVGRSRLLLGEFSKAIDDFTAILPVIDRVRDPDYPLYVRAQTALARGHLELGDASAARRALPNERGILFRDQSVTAADAWIKHLEGDASQRENLMNQLKNEMEAHPPTTDFSLSVSQLQKSMQRDNETPTMVWRANEI